MDEEAWRKLSEKERQRLLMEAKLLQRMLNKELYGSDWLRRIAELEGDEAALRELKRLQREKYEKMMRLKLLNRKRPQNKDGDLLIEIPTEWFDDPDEGKGRNLFKDLTDTGEDSKLVHRQIWPKMDTSIFFFFPTRPSDEYDSAASRKYSHPLWCKFACIG